MLKRLGPRMNPILGLCFALIVFLTSVFGSYVLSLFIPLLLFNAHKRWRIIADRAIAFWFFIPTTILQYFFGTSFKITGDPIEIDKPALVLMNHRTRLDWMYYWGALLKMNPWLLVSSKIALKAELKYLPGAGVGMAGNQFIFLKRNMNEDKIALDKAIDYFANIGYDYQILFFPEGTDKSERTTKKSNDYAKKNGLPELKYVIYPRSAGLVHLIRRMREHNYISCIYNVTVAYPENTVQSEIDLVLKGIAPSKVHFNIERIDRTSIPRQESDIAKWINEYGF
ncbi:unnamed protein product [Dracunculus medinensis]|uniref:PlsC domain-containing protein n=1 Tax=Dracunculus medinensis TaxID=318479 RepID=A0A0N4U0V5_DRAME|nr:unnamed protein product [Dracunculus medinensis]